MIGSRIRNPLYPENQEPERGHECWRERLNKPAWRQMVEKETAGHREGGMVLADDQACRGRSDGDDGSRVVFR